jgi:hypothetical protein
VTLDQTLVALTGEALNPSYLAAECNRSSDDMWRVASDALSRGEEASAAPEQTGLDASISIVHGGERVAGNDESLSGMYAAFESWIKQLPAARYESSAAGASAK